MNDLKIEIIADKYSGEQKVKLDSKEQCIFIESKILEKDSKIIFYIDPSLYYIAFDNKITFNYIEDQKITNEDVCTDIDTVLLALRSQKLFLEEYKLLNIHAYTINGLPAAHYVQQLSPMNSLVLKFGKLVSKDLIT